MAVDNCSPCECIPASMDAETFHNYAINALCAILAEMQAGTTDQDVNLVEVGGVAVTLGQKAMAASLPVVIASDQTWVGATNLGKAEDAPAASGDTGVLSLAVRNGAGTATAADGDYIGITTDQYGGVWIAGSRLEDSVAVSGDSGVMALTVIQATPVASAADGDYGSLKTDALGKLWTAGAQTEDAVAASGDSGVALLAVQTATPASTAAEGDYGWLKTDALGKLWTANCQTEDLPAASGDRGSFCLALRNGAGTGTAADGDYIGLTTDQYGGLWIAGSRSEDSVHVSGDAGVVALSVIQATPAASAADGDYGNIKSSALGVLFNEPSNSVATYGGTTTAGAAGAVPTTGVSVHTNAAKAKIITVANLLDVPVQISLDGGTTYISYVPVNGNLILDLGTNGRWTASNIFAKAIGSNSASGNIYVGTVI